jgi:peptidoglycan/xylan/chitin deacetylase (PgdA/CDA1 family)
LSWWRAALGKGKTRWLEARHRRSVRVVLDRPIVSIAFDDVPLSAFHNGVPLLESYDARGTFYVCLGIKDGDPPTGYIGTEEIAELHRRGHEIGCHTLSHYRLSQGNDTELQSDARLNREGIRQLLGDEWPRSFSFPFGELSFEAKKGLAPYYQSLRGNRPGVNAGVADFNCLRAVSLERDNCSTPQLARWLDLAEHKTGWLIVYSHGVLSKPDYFDIRPEALSWLLNECRRRALQILPVWRAAEQLTASAVARAMPGPGEAVERHSSSDGRPAF